MKELQNFIRVEQHEERQQEQQFKLIGQLTHKPGLTLFEYDPSARTLVNAEIVQEKTAVVVLPSKDGIKKGVRLNKDTGKPLDKTIGKVKFRAGCYYFEALNFENAAKKIDKILKGTA